MGEVVYTREEMNPALDWDTDQARAERYLRRSPQAAGMSDEEITRWAARAVSRRRQARAEILSRQLV